MTNCPHCHADLVEERIGGTHRNPHGRRVLLCAPCSTVYAFEPKPILRLVDRRDLA